MGGFPLATNRHPAPSFRRIPPSLMYDLTWMIHSTRPTTVLPLADSLAMTDSLCRRGTTNPCLYQVYCRAPDPALQAKRQAGVDQVLPCLYNLFLVLRFHETVNNAARLVSIHCLAPIR